MNIRAYIIVLIAMILGAGAAYQLRQMASRPQAAGETSVRASRKTFPVRETGGIEQGLHSAPLPRPKPPLIKNSDNTPVEASPPAARKQPDRQPPKPPDPYAYWEHQLKRFNRLLEQLEHEQEPSRRIALIRALAAYVRIDTLGALEWAMGLNDPEERRTALEAINKSALTGVGARIESDDSGYPVIRETTVLSAIAATGLVEPGDYIVGMVNPDGQHVSFEQLSMRQVVNYLRGPSGSEIQLLIKKSPLNLNSGSDTFAVSVQRSLLVIQPPY